MVVSAARPVFDQLRSIESLRLASGKLRASQIFAGHYRSIDPADFRRSFSVKEDIPEDGVALPHRPVNTFHLLLDTRDERYSCSNNIVIGPDNLVLYEDGIPFEEMSIRLRLLEHPRRVRGTVGYLSNTNPDVYYHWLAFVLPLVGIYRDRVGTDPDFYYIGRPVKPFQLETLARAGINPERVLSDAVVADRLIADMPDRKRREGAVDRAMLAFSRELYYSPPTRSPKRRLFLGRRDCHRRRLANEEECADYAARYGFESVAMEGRTVAEQAQLLADAAFIIAPHGGALTNVLFATSQTSVLELLPASPAASSSIDAPLLTVFREICAFVGCRYDRVFGAPLPTQRRVPQSHADFSISFDEFRAKLAAMLEA
jgi:hypothetical protein